MEEIKYIENWFAFGLFQDCTVPVHSVDEALLMMGIKNKSKMAEKKKISATPEELKTLYYEKRMTQKAISEFLETSESHIAYLFRKHNIISDKDYLPRSKIDDAEILRLYDEGLSTLKIAKIAGVSDSSVRKHLIKNGRKCRTKSESQKMRRKEVS